jgi:hypothetical protein
VVHRVDRRHGDHALIRSRAARHSSAFRVARKRESHGSDVGEQPPIAARSSCRLLLVEADTSSFANLAAAVNKAAGLGAKVIGNSYGSGESGSASIESSYNHAGIAVTASSGDSGFGVQFPASRHMSGQWQL